MFPYILFVSLAALISGALNSVGKFAVAAAAPVLLNIIILAALGTSWVIGGSAITFLIWSVPAAGILQLGLVWYHARQSGLKLTLARPRFSTEMKHLLIVATPAALANGVVQINLLVGQLVSSQQVGAISWLYGADRLYQLPLGVVGIAVGIVLLPELSRHLKSGDEGAAKEALSNGAFFTEALSFPATIALFVIPLPLAAALYGYGQNTIADVQAIALATAIYALGLPAFMLQKLQQPLFFAREDTKTPFRWAVVSMVLNAIVAIGLWPALGWLSPAIATVVSSWAMVGLLHISSRAFGDVARVKSETISKIGRVAIASIAMGVVLGAAQFSAGGYFTNGVTKKFLDILLRHLAQSARLCVLDGNNKCWFSFLIPSRRRTNVWSPQEFNQNLRAKKFKIINHNGGIVFPPLFWRLYIFQNIFKFLDSKIGKFWFFPISHQIMAQLDNNNLR